MPLRRLTGLLLVAWLLCSFTTARAADGPVADMPWLHEGLSLSYVWHSALLPGNGNQYCEDEAGKLVVNLTGKFRDPNTGKIYDQSPQQGVSANGINQAVVACIDGDKVVVTIQTFAVAPVGGLGGKEALVFQQSAGEIADVANPGEYWMDPHKLAALRSDSNQGITVSSIKWNTDKEAVQAIRVENVQGDAYSNRIYDARSGVVLHVSTISVGAAPTRVGPGDLGKGDTTYSRSDFVATRDIVAPWAQEATPAWVQQFQALRYSGQGHLRGGALSGFAPPTLISMDLTPSAHGNGWVQLNSASLKQIQGLPSTAPPAKGQIACGRAQFDGLWAGPAALAKLKTGQVLDDDPVTKMKTVVSQVGDNSVVITSANDGCRIADEYDKQTGMLRTHETFNGISGEEDVLRLESHR
jgi:hypothetical protein